MILFNSPYTNSSNCPKMSFIAFSSNQGSNQDHELHVDMTLFLPSLTVYLLLLFCTIALARPSRVTVKRSGGRKHSYLVPDITGEASSFSSLSI